MNLFQTPEWEKFKLATGYQNAHRIDGVLVLQKSLPLRRSMLYTPMLDRSLKEVVKRSDFISQIRKIAAGSKAIFYRLEIDDSSENSDGYKLKNNGFVKAFEEMQPEHTLILDISRSEDEILAQMKPKGRYNIKVAEKNKLRVEEEKSADNFYKLYQAMAGRQKITYRTLSYFQKLIDILGSAGYCKLLTAYAEGDTPLASIIVSFVGQRATYLFGGSSNEQREKMAPYLLQWTAIREARSRGCTEYDFYGVAPNDDPKHPWAGVTRYKKQFGGSVVNLTGNWDLKLRSFEYQAFKIAEKMRRG